MNRLTDAQRRMIVAGIGLLMILFGAAQGIFKLDFCDKYKRVIDEVFLILMMFAAVVFFSKRRSQPEPESPRDAAAPEKITETAEGSDEA